MAYIDGAAQQVTASGAGTFKLNVQLKKTGEAKLNPTIAYTPISGQGTEQTTKLKLKKKAKKK